MAKKKNRKKELRQQQRLEIKLMSEQEEEFFEQLISQPPIFVERRQIPHFDEEQEALIAYVQSSERENGDFTQADINHVRSLLDQGKFSFPKVTQLFRQAMHTPDDTKRAKLLQQVLALKPNHFLAQFHLLLTEENPFEPMYFEKVWQFYDQTKLGWKAHDYLDWAHWEARPYLTAFNYIILYLHSQGFLGLAAEVVDLILSKRPESLAPDFLHLALSLYNELGRFEQVEALYHRYLTLLPQHKDSLLFHLMLSKLLRGQVSDAQKIFVSLTEANEEAADFFSNIAWLEDLFDVTEMEVYRPFTAKSLSVTAYHLQEFFERNLLVSDYLYRFARDCGGRSEESEWFDFLTGYHATLFSGLRLNIYQTLFHENLRSPEDFQQLTEKEFLAIKGIGQKTLDQLKANGVTFKES